MPDIFRHNQTFFTFPLHLIPMTRFLIILLLFVSAAGSMFETSAQTTKSAGASNIVDRIIATSDSTILIDIPENLMNELLPGNAPANVRKVKTAVEKPRLPGIVSGYRIQIFADGRNQNTLQARARARANAVLQKFPEFRHQVYSFSKAPNWYTRIGNFATRAEAESALGRIRRAFPAFSSEIRIVKSNVVINR